MQMDLTEEQQMIRDTARQFADSELAPNAAALDEHEGREILLGNLKNLAELGFMGLNIEAQYGGTEAGVIAFSTAITELARGCAATAVTVSVTNMVAEVIQAIGNDQQKSTYLPRICSGEYPAAGFCLTETGAGSDPAAMRTRAVRVGDEWVLNGSKIYITSAEYAGCFVVWAVTDAEAAKGKGISCFIVDNGLAGIDISKAEDKMGQRGSATNVVNFTDCRIPASALMGSEGQGFKVAVGELAGGRIGIGSLALGVGLGNFQGIQWMLADRYTELEAARLLLMQAAWDKQQGRDFGTSAAMAKLFASEKANDACYSALQMMGGAGYIREYPLERMARDVRVTSIYEGTSEIQRVIIARNLLKDVL